MRSINGEFLSPEFIYDSDRFQRILNEKFEYSASLSAEFNEKIYESAEGEILIQNIYGGKGLLFQSKHQFYLFQNRFTFTYIKSQEKVLFIEKIEDAKKELNDLALTKHSSLEKRTGMQVYVDEYERLIVIDERRNEGFVYASVEEFLLMRTEYGFDKNDIFIAVGE